jgi:glycosyltransferase involved in cell wall biosynthesis
VSLRIRNDLGFAKKIVGVYAGKFGDFYLEDEIFELIKIAFRFWDDKLHILLLSNIEFQQLEEFCKKYDLDNTHFTLINSSYKMMPQYLSVADFAISPYKPAPSKRYCTPIKNGEYWAIGLPIIITTGVSIDSDIVQQNAVGYVLENLSVPEYEKIIQKIDELLNGDREELRTRIRRIAEEKRNFSIAENIYQQIYS